MLRVTLSTRTDVTVSAAFNTCRLEESLLGSVQATLSTWTAPCRVQGGCAVGITAATALSVDDRYCKRCVPTATTPYFNSGSALPFTDFGMRLSMMLGAATLAEAQVLTTAAWPPIAA